MSTGRPAVRAAMTSTVGSRPRVDLRAAWRGLRASWPPTLRSWALALVLTLGVATLAPAAATADDALAQLRALVPAVPAEGLVYANALEMAGLPEQAADLRLAMFTAHVDLLNGRPPPPGVTLGAAMDGAKSLPAARPGTPLASAWASAFPRQVALDWTAGELPASYRWMASTLKPVRPGGWWQTAGPLPLKVVATVELAQRGSSPVTLIGFRLRWSDELVLDCEPAVIGTRATDPVRAFVCGGAAPPSMKEAFAHGTPTVVPRHLDSAERYRDLLYAISSSERRNLHDWIDRLRGQPDAAARAAARDSERRAASRASGGREWRKQIGRSLSGALVVALVLGVFVVGRRWRRDGTSESTIGLMSFVALAGIALIAIVAFWRPPSGEGWGRGASLFMALWVVGSCAAAGLVLRLMHRMDRLLLREDLAWSAAVFGACSRVLDFRGGATKAGFWGYMGFWFATALSVGLVLPAAAPVVTLLLLVPVPALLWRRFRALTPQEAWGLVVLVLAVGGIVALDR